MAARDNRLGEYIASEVRKYAGVYVPGRVNPLMCQLRRSARLKHVHPNPEDEFCQPKVGPSYEIISEYEHQFREARRHSHIYCDEPVIVQKIRPDGFMLLNGHHRWGAALRLGYKRIPIKLVNLTQETDINKMLASSKHDKRVTLDLDEVVFSEKSGAPSDRALPFPLNRFYKERLRLGIPALFHFLARNGYDIWVYSAAYYSMTYIRALLKRYRVGVSGIVTGTARKGSADPEVRERVKDMFARKYKYTLHIDGSAVVQILGEDRFKEFALDGDMADWSRSVMDTVRKIEGEGKLKG